MGKYEAGTILVNHGAGLINHHCVFNPENASAEVGKNADAMCLTGVVGGYKEHESIEDAKRIAACLNVCADINTKTLEQVGTIKNYSGGIVNLESENKMLIAALKDAQSFISGINTVGGRYHGLTGLVVQDSYKEFQKIENVFNELKGKK